MPSFNLVNKFGGLAFGRDDVKPSPRNHNVLRQAKHPVSNGIAMVMIVEKPAVNVALAQSSLYGGKVHGRMPILAMFKIRWALSGQDLHRGVPSAIRPTQLKRQR